MYKFNDTIPNCPNFKWSEFFMSEKSFLYALRVSNLNHHINIIQNIILLASALQLLRNRLGTPIYITKEGSAYRTLSENANAGGSSNSWHMRGLAVDCWWSGLNYDHCKLIFLKKEFTGVIFYPNDKFVHLDLRYTNPYLAKSF